jgi:hypothetical protein
MFFIENGLLYLVIAHDTPKDDQQFVECFLVSNPCNNSVFKRLDVLKKLTNTYDCFRLEQKVSRRLMFHTNGNLYYSRSPISQDEDYYSLLCIDPVMGIYRPGEQLYCSKKIVQPAPQKFTKLIHIQPKLIQQYA